MAPLKYEEQLRDKLEKRTLQPSPNAWEKLSNHLDHLEKKNTNKSYWWLGLAASIVGMVFIISQIFNNNNTKDGTEEVVSVPEAIISQDQEEAIEIASESIKTEKEPLVEERANEIEKPKVKDSKILDNYNQTEVAVTKEDNIKNDQILANKSHELPQKELTFEEQKIQDVFAQVKSLSKGNNEITDADIDALLLQAQKEIKLNRMVDKTTGLVDANSLLQDVEAELDQSFRSRVFEAIKSSYSSVKSAVAQRNN